jgi:protein-S-isoprenylcysteine O-methyltransferase Ste14
LTVLYFLIWGVLAIFWGFSNPALPKPDIKIPVKFPIEPILAIPWWAGLAIGIALIATAGILTHAAEKTHRESRHHPKKITKLNTTGLYAGIRHPIYLGALFINFGIPFLFRSLWMFAPAALFCIVIYLEAKQEEKYLIDKFDEQYIEYKARTGMFLPKIRRRHK